MHLADPWLVGVVFFVTAVLYSSVGNAGASGYLAVMTLAGMPPGPRRQESDEKLPEWVVNTRSCEWSPRLKPTPFSVKLHNGAFATPVCRSEQRVPGFAGVAGGNAAHLSGKAQQVSM